MAPQNNDPATRVCSPADVRVSAAIQLSSCITWVMVTWLALASVLVYPLVVHRRNPPPRAFRPPGSASDLAPLSCCSDIFPVCRSRHPSRLEPLVAGSRRTRTRMPPPSEGHPLPGPLPLSMPSLNPPRLTCIRCEWNCSDSLRSVCCAPLRSGRLPWLRLVVEKVGSRWPTAFFLYENYSEFQWVAPTGRGELRAEYPRQKHNLCSTHMMNFSSQNPFHGEQMKEEGYWTQLFIASNVRWVEAGWIGEKHTGANGNLCPCRDNCQPM